MSLRRSVWAFLLRCVSASPFAAVEDHRAHNLRQRKLTRHLSRSWTDRYYMPLAYLAILIPALLAASVWIMPKRWWPWSWSLGCFCCRSRRRRKRENRYRGVVDGEGGPNDSKVDLGASTATLATPLAPSYPPSPLASPPTKPSLLDRAILVRRWHFSLFLLLLCAPVGAIIHAFMPTPLNAFLSSMEDFGADSKLAGSFYWSLFGKDDSCCSYVQHNDGYTLHYPSSAETKGSGERVAELTRHAWRLRGEAPPYWSDGISSLGLGDLPTVQCPQESLALPANASWSG